MAGLADENKLRWDEAWFPLNLNQYGHHPASEGNLQKVRDLIPDDGLE